MDKLIATKSPNQVY